MTGIDREREIQKVGDCVAETGFWQVISFYEDVGFWFFFQVAVEGLDGRREKKV